MDGIWSDERIIALYFERDERAIEKTDLKYGKYLFTVADTVLHSEEDSKECVNDTYLRVWQAIPPERPQYFRAFLTKIIRGIALNRYSDLKRQKRIPSALCDSFDSIEGWLPEKSEAEAREDALAIGEVLNRYLKGITRRRRYIFISRFFYLKPIEAIARALTVSESTVNKEIKAIRRGIEKACKEAGIWIF
ncbi:MAG: sigma-70 family RNA polymerase sigma factor [Clostridia bacterium]|nr:sigma-70 family RNA polymerase sigma factor [Clostridia bacterium]